MVVLAAFLAFFFGSGRASNAMPSATVLSRWAVRMMSRVEFVAGVGAEVVVKEVAGVAGEVVSVDEDIVADV